MKKYLLNSVLILFISAVSISCTNELTMDTSSDKAFAESLAKFQKKLKPKEFEKLGEVILAVSLYYGWKNLGNPKKGGEEAKRRLHGKTYKEIIGIYDDIKKD